MACAQTANSEVHKGRVKDACNKFLMKADELYALKLQDEEYYQHYDKNRRMSQNIRNDLPMAKSIQDTEYQELLKRHQKLEEIEQQDALIALKIQNELIEEAKKEKMSLQMTDIELAKQLQESELLKDTQPSNPPVTVPSPQAVVKKTLERTKSVPIQVPTTRIDSGASQVSFRGQAENLRRMSSIPVTMNKYEVIKEEETLNEEDEYIQRLKKEQEDLSLAKYLQEQEEKKIQIQTKIKAKSKELLEMNDEQIARALQEEEQARYREYLKSKTEQSVETSKRASVIETGSNMNSVASGIPVMPVSPIQPIYKSSSTSSSSSSSSLSNTKQPDEPHLDEDRNVNRNSRTDSEAIPRVALNNLNEDKENKEMTYVNPTQVQSRPKKIRFNLDANVLFEDDTEFRQYGEFLIQNNYAAPNTTNTGGVNYRRPTPTDTSRVISPPGTPSSARANVRSDPLPHTQPRQQPSRATNSAGPYVNSSKASSPIHLLRKRLNPRHSKTIDRLANLFHHVK